jgi:nitroreductase
MPAPGRQSSVDIDHLPLPHRRANRVRPCVHHRHMNPQAFDDLLSRHRSIRAYRPDPVDPALVEQVLVAALQGGSSSGNLNMVSVVRTTDVERKRRLYELHGEQPMVLQAPLVLTFCADTHRTRAWLALRGARLGFGDLMSWTTSAFDAMILAQTSALALQSRGLGICYMGTTMFAMNEIADFLELPEHCVPVTSLVVGWPDEAPPQRDRLPGRAWIHDERYTRPTPQTIERDFAEREVRGRQRYLSMGPEMQQRWDELGITSLAQYYTSRIKYDPDAFRGFSKAIREGLERRGFWP